MATVNVTNWKKEKVGSVDLAPTVFEVEVKEEVLHSVVRWQLASRRQGTHMTKTKGLVSGGGKKPFKQKGTGNARQGSLRSPQYRGGGIIFGPKPITATYKINKKEKVHARKVLISKLFAAGCITIVDEIKLPSFRTQDAIKAVKNLELKGSIAMIHNNEISYEGLKSVSNIPYVGAYSSDSFHIHEIVKYDNIVFTRSAFEKFTQVL